MTGNERAGSVRKAFEECRDMDASLNERLAAMAAQVRALEPAFAQAVDRLVERLHGGGAGSAAPRVGDVMPPFMLPDDGGHLVTLEELIAQGPVAVIFHRGHWCPYCRINSYTLAQANHTVAADGGQIVAIMPETQRYVAEFRADTSAKFPILTDIDNGYAMSLNLAIWIGDEMQQFLAARGRNLPQYQGSDSWTVPIPASFVVGTDGRIKARFVDPDYRKRMAIEDLIAAIRSAARAA